MERYTEKHYDGNSYYLVCSGNCETLNCGNCDTLDKTDGIFIQGKLYSKKKLCLDWFQMSNDDFYDLYGFNFNPHEYPGLYDWGRQTLYGE